MLRFIWRAEPSKRKKICDAGERKYETKDSYQTIRSVPRSQRKAKIL
jgi:hypothetical protein